jgi:glycosyltransferase involved in cell wall biosynthesis
MMYGSEIRLLYLVPERLPTHRADVEALFCKYLPRRGVHGTLVGKGSTSAGTADSGFDIKTSDVGGNRLMQEFRYLWLCLQILCRASSREYSFIQVRDMVSIGFLALLIARVKGIPFIYWASFLMCEGRLTRARTNAIEGRRTKAAALWLKASCESWLLYRVILPSAKHVFVQSVAMRRHMKLRGISPDKMTPVPMGVDMEASREFPKVIEPSEHPTATPVVGYLGTLDAQRKLTVLIEALAQVRLSMPNVELLFIGDSDKPADRATLVQCAAHLHLSNAVRFTGWLPTHEAWTELSAVSLCISPFPRGEILDTNSPTKLVEYLALGIPCIGNDNPDQRDVLTASDAGWLVEGDSPSAYATAILSVLGDLRAARIRAAKGPAYVQATRSYETISTQVTESYRQIATSSR